MEILTETQLVQSHKKATTSYCFTNLNLTQKPNELRCTQNPFPKTCLETKCTLLPPLPNSIELAPIFTLLPLMDSTMSPKVKTVEREEVGALSLAHST